MSCYLFTYHAYRSWMPDRPQGYVRRHEGILSSDREMARLYARKDKHDMVRILSDVQLEAIATLQEAVCHIGCRLLFVATDSTHVHSVVSWVGERTWLQNRTSLKRSLTITLKQKFGKRPWLSEGASRKQVRDQAHFDYLVTQYLPKHSGWKWDERRGLFK